MTVANLDRCHEKEIDDLEIAIAITGNNNNCAPAGCHQETPGTSNAHA
jgi:hypothetical protein